MKINKQTIQSSAIKFVVEDNGKMVGYAHLFLITNHAHGKAYGLLESVFVEKEYRGNGTGTELIKAVVQEAKDQGCYKLIGTSRSTRPKVHELYEGLGFKKWGVEFRMDFV